jgi:hypothetical protein
VIYVSPAGDAERPRFLALDPPQYPDKPDTRLPVQDERLISHQGCACLHPLVSFEGQEREAGEILDSGLNLDTAELRKLVTGILDASAIAAISRSSNDHWSFVRMRQLAQQYPGLKGMWFPERMFPWVEETESTLPIFVMGPRKTGKSVFSTMACSPNSYAGLGEEVSFQQNFGYAPPRLASKPYEDYELLLRNLHSAKYSYAETTATQKQSALVVAAFFSKPLPFSEVDTVTVYDIAGEWHERDFSLLAAKMRRDKMYWCLVVSVEDLIVFRGAGRGDGSSVASAVEKILAAAHDQRIAIIVTKMDKVQWPLAPTPGARQTGEQSEALMGVRRVLSGKGTHPRSGDIDEDSRKAFHQHAGQQGRQLLYALLDEKDLKESRLRSHLGPESKIRAVFFTGVRGWDKTAQYVHPFGIGEAVCWMAEDLSEGSTRAPGILSRTMHWLGSRVKAKHRGKADRGAGE